MPDRPIMLPRSTEKAYDLGFKIGAQHGYDELRQEALTWLQHKYVEAPDKPDRGSPAAEALLELARELTNHLTDVKMRKTW